MQEGLHFWHYLKNQDKRALASRGRFSARKEQIDSEPQKLKSSSSKSSILRMQEQNMEPMMLRHMMSTPNQLPQTQMLLPDIPLLLLLSLIRASLRVRDCTKHTGLKEQSKRWEMWLPKLLIPLLHSMPWDWSWKLKRSRELDSYLGIGYTW